ncbi:MAG: hypothetical protein KF690_11190 [Bacteroidetes bacterium]|nr:hypothetical protein [Bacteroidota bacterium]
MDDQLLTAIIGIGAAMVGASSVLVSVSLSSRHQRKNEQKRILFDARKEAYLDYLKTVALISDKESRNKKAKLVESKLLISLLGGDAVVMALHKHYEEIEIYKKNLGELEFDIDKLLLAKICSRFQIL